MKPPRSCRSPRGRSFCRPNAVRAAARQRGVVLLFSLIALVVMLIVAAGLVRSFNSSLFSAGNIGFKRDLQNQSERAVAKVLAEFRGTGSLATADKRKALLTASNYSATMLATNAQGVPDALQNDTTFATVGVATNDIAVPEMNVTLRYVVDRLCATAGDETSLGPDACRLSDNAVPAGTSESNWQGAERSINGKAGAVPRSIVYRLSIRVAGPRNTQSFFQSTFTVPSV
jgi:type IV pilus assembly protein PilX